MDTPETLGRFRIERELGRGAMGVVYVAEDPVLHRRVAIKAIRIHPGLAEDHVEELRQRFVNEARAAANLSHPNIVAIYDAASENESLFIAMELVEGESLEDVFGAERILTYKEMADLALQLGSALDHAHERGVVHRDIKPANVLIDRRGKPKIADFGVARQATSTLTATGTIIGTPAYMSPEQITGHPVTGAADQFSLGVVLYEALTGRKPFHGDGATTVLYKIVHEEPELPVAIRQNLPPEVDRVVLRALAKDPAERYPTCTELAEELRKALKAAPAGAAEMLATGAARAAAPASITDTDPGARPQRGARAAPAKAAGTGTANASRAGAKAGRARSMPLNAPTLLAAAAAVVVVLLGLFWVLGDSEEPESLAAAEAAPMVETEPTAEPDPAAAEAVPVATTWRIVSRPQGARVTVDGRVLAGRTPVEVSLDAGSRHTLLLELSDHESVTWAFVPEELPEEQRRSGQLFFPLRDASQPATVAVSDDSEPAAAAAAVPTVQEPLDDPVRLGPRDSRPTAIHRVQPEFPDWAAQEGLQRYVILETTIDKTGRVREARVLQAVHPDLERLALQAILQWRFTPAFRDGDRSEPIDVVHNVTVAFEDGDAAGERH